ncbi:MAG: hypothetical protein IPF53_19725 [Blastocatellia bacterium]|nr:hypothetical protein [Blastocatellia bacterium]
MRFIRRIARRSNETFAAVAEALEADEFREALDEGRGMSIEDAVSDAVAARETGRPGVSGA